MTPAKVLLKITTFSKSDPNASRHHYYGSMWFRGEKIREINRCFTRGEVVLKAQRLMKLKTFSEEIRNSRLTVRAGVKHL